MQHFSSATEDILDIPLEIIRFIGDNQTDDDGNITGVKFKDIVNHFKSQTNSIIKIHNNCFTYEAIIYGYLGQLWHNQNTPNFIQKTPITTPTQNWSTLIQTNTGMWMLSTYGIPIYNSRLPHQLHDQKCFKQPFQNVLTHFKHLQSTAKDLACIRIATRPDYSVDNSAIGEFLARFMYGQSLDAQGKAQLAGDQVLNTLSHKDNPNRFLNKTNAQYSITDAGRNYLQTFQNNYEIRVDDTLFFTIHFNIETGQCDVIEHSIDSGNQPLNQDSKTSLNKDNEVLTIKTFVRISDNLKLSSSP